jgi:hypothetical protein
VSRSDDLRLLDIIEASERIARIIARGRGAFREDEAVQPALERLLEVIGESANAMSEDARSAVANTGMGRCPTPSHPSCTPLPPRRRGPGLVHCHPRRASAGHVDPFARPDLQP